METALLVLLAVLLTAAFFLYRERRVKPIKSQEVEVLACSSRIDESEEEQPKQDSEEALPPVVVSEICVGRTAEIPAIRIRHVDADAYHEANNTPIPSDSSLFGQINSIFQVLPQAASSALVASGNYMNVSISGNLVSAGDGVGFRAFAMQDGKIVEHAKLFDGGNLSTVLNSALAWQIASTLVAQKHLADISKKLNSIKSGINEINEFLDSQRKSKILGALTYMEQAHYAIQNGEREPHMRIRLEQIEAQLCGIHEHLLLEIESNCNSMMLLDDNSIGTEDYADRINQKFTSVNGSFSQIILNAKARAACWQLLLAYPGEQNLKAVRHEAISGSVSQIVESSSNYNRCADTKIKTIESWFNLQSTIDARKNALQARCDSISTDVNSGKRHIFEHIEQATRFANELGETTTISLKVENGTVIEAHKIEA